MRRKFLVFLLTFLAAGVWQQNAATVTAEESEMPMLSEQISPILDKDGADPFVTKFGEQYLYTKTTGSNISIGIADSIQTLGASKLKMVYKPGNELKDLWAPEIWHLDDIWYIYFAAVLPGEEMHHMFVLKNESENPLEGTWTCEPLLGMDDKFAIDGTIMELNGTRYFLWSGWEGYENVRQDIYLAEMVSPTEVKDEKILLSVPELDWELHGNPLINEGPEVVVEKDTVNLVYSASGSWTDDYCLGLLTMDTTADPKDAESWTKQDTPILSKDKDVYGPGHNCFTLSKDGQDNLNIYHAARWQGAGWTRSVRFGYMTFDENGKILPMEVASGDECIALPSGEEPIQVYPAENFTLSEKIELVENGEEKNVTGFVSAKDTASFTIDADEEKEAIAAVFVKADKQINGAVTRLVMENGEEKEIQEVYAGKNSMPVYFHLNLKQGENIITLYSNTGGAGMEINRVEIRK